MSIAYLVTGTTRGIGRALAEVIRDDRHSLFSLSSQRDSKAPGLCNTKCDLGRTDQVSAAGRHLVRKMIGSKPDALVLINNAAVLDPIGPLVSADPETIVRHLLVNQAAPATLMSIFIAMTSQFAGTRHIINISSGAARTPYAGWAMYCGTKAAMDMMTLCAAMEQQANHTGAEICAVYPGKVDTGMQASIRRTAPSLFPRHADFIGAKVRGELLAPKAVARLIIDLYRQGQFKNGGIYDLRSARTDRGRCTIEPARTIGAF
jgi:benzil reductase ((S)-benzoin forming)